MIYTRTLLLCFAFCILLLIYNLYNKIITDNYFVGFSVSPAFFQSYSWQLDSVLDETMIDIPTIVGWTTFYSDNITQSMRGTYDGCVYKCNLMERDEFNGSDIIPSAYIFHGANMDPKDLPLRYSHQMIVFMSKEPPALSGHGYKQVSPDYFNATITYRSDADYVWPYGRLSEQTKYDRRGDYYTLEQIESAIDKKTDGSVAFITHCKTESKREDYIVELAKYTNITVYGNCPFRTTTEYCPKREKFCENPIIAKHRFYLAFENSFCEEYITEKFFKRLRSLIVPIVLKRRFYNIPSIPPGSFIAADDYSSPRELADYLEYLSNNRTAYKEYFDWTHHYKKRISFGTSLCQLCTDLHQKIERTIVNIVKHIEQKKCYQYEDFP